MPRWRVTCDGCNAGGWIGARPAGPPAVIDAWCEGCQRGHALSDPEPSSPSCPHCGGSLTTGEPRFEELPGNARHLAGILYAWCGDPGPLAALQPDRPRLMMDLDAPDPRPGDSGGARAGLEALSCGRFARAYEVLADAVRAPGEHGHLWRALGVAAQRLDDLPAAEDAFSCALEADPHDTAARLDRGALRARRGDHAGARTDFALAGDRHEARWNRAAVLVMEAVASSPGLPAPGMLTRARAEAGEPSSYWSDPTVGRLLWTLLVDRLHAAGAVPRRAAERLLHWAEQQLEFSTFWDRALVAHGYARLGMRSQAGRVAAATAEELLASLAAEPFARGPAGAWLGATLQVARTAVSERRPGDALAVIRTLMERPDVSRYRVPCIACVDGSLGVESSEAAERRD